MIIDIWVILIICDVGPFVLPFKGSKLICRSSFLIDSNRGKIEGPLSHFCTGEPFLSCSKGSRKSIDHVAVNNAQSDHERISLWTQIYRNNKSSRLPARSSLFWTSGTLHLIAWCRLECDYDFELRSSGVEFVYCFGSCLLARFKKLLILESKKFIITPKQLHKLHSYLLIFKWNCTLRKLSHHIFYPKDLKITVKLI